MKSKTWSGWTILWCWGDDQKSCTVRGLVTSKSLKKLWLVVYRVQDKQPSSRNRVVVHFDRLKPCPNDIRVKAVVQNKLKWPDSSSDHKQPAQPPGKDLQFFEDDDHDVLRDSRKPSVNRETEQPSTSQQPDMLGRAVHPHTATDGEPLDTTPELTSGINSDGTVLEPTTATSPSSRPGESGSVRHQKQTRQSPPEEWTSCYPKRTCHAPPITIGILVGDVKAPVVGVPLCKKDNNAIFLHRCLCQLHACAGKCI